MISEIQQLLLENSIRNLKPSYVILGPTEAAELREELKALGYSDNEEFEEKTVVLGCEILYKTSPGIAVAFGKRKDVRVFNRWLANLSSSQKG